MMMARPLQTSLRLNFKLNLWRCSVKSLSSLTGSRYVSSPVDDKENNSVISDLLVYERRKQFKSNIKLSNEDTNVEVRKRDANSKKRDKLGSGNVALNSDQQRIINLMKAVKFKNLCYIVRQDAADTLVEHLKKDLREGDVIAEANLGPGVLTKTILEQTVHKVIGYEPNTEFLLHLRSEMNGYADRLELHCLDLFRFYWYYTLNKREPEREGETDRLAQLLEPLLTKEGQESSVRIVASLSEMSVLHKLTLSYTFQCCFFKDIFPILYLYVPDHVHEHLTSLSRNITSKRLRVPFAFYFDVEHLDTAPNSSFYSPHLRSKKFKIKEKIFHLMKITPRENVHEIVAKHELPTFHYFMRCLINAKSGESLIFHMEKWIPGCGIDYIKNGFRMFVHPRELTTEQLLAAYRLFTSLSSFKECMFHQFCKNWTIQFGLKDDDIPQKMETEDAADKEMELFDDVHESDEDETVKIKR
ncbi:dimethyladenosine transferase 2, mitochondrial [Macrobrachium rosenbergii]|uniref:dimethyladenosine transferase 2, mitochondrial n=1 Tax=Macrobrachium rosenbergii TaxID=79674 RepID=UPI0034D4C9AA